MPTLALLVQREEHQKVKWPGTKSTNPFKTLSGRRSSSPSSLSPALARPDLQRQAYRMRKPCHCLHHLPSPSLPTDSFPPAETSQLPNWAHTAEASSNVASEMTPPSSVNCSPPGLPDTAFFSSPQGPASFSHFCRCQGSFSLTLHCPWALALHCP